MASPRSRFFCLLTLVFWVQLIGSCVDGSLRADLEGPQVVSASLVGPRSVEVGTAEVFEVRFSEPLDPESLGIGSLVIVPWESVGDCEFVPTCEEGSCERGRCQIDPLSEADLKRIDRGDFDPEIAIEWSLGESAAGPRTRLRIWPEVALAGRWRHSLVIGGGLRDLAGAPLVDDSGQRTRWRRDFVTAGVGSSGPEAELVVPSVGEQVPPNLGRVLTEFPRPVAQEVAGLSLDLLGENGSIVPLVDPEACAGWVSGYCLQWRIQGALDPASAYRLGGGSLVDRRGQEAVEPHGTQWFITGATADDLPPDPSSVQVERRARCVHARVIGSEALTLRLEIDGRSAIASSVATPGQDEPYALEVALALDPWPSPGTEISLAIELEDRAGNRAADLRLLDPPGATLPPLAFSEVLANPAGAEPDQEMIEILDLRTNGPETGQSGLWIADRPWAEVAAAIASGGAPGRILPAFSSVPGQRTVVVGQDYNPDDPGDPAPLAGAVVLHVGGSLGSGGLGNGGEPLVLYDLESAALVSSYEQPISVQTAQGRSVVNVHPGGCDVATSWQKHPLGTSSPGWAP
ncbi:MAG TPA: hypothetical protein ENJ18_04140 [Nannocystis exedens]|nr:hypothetical protein [Nannocystis exedens]